VKIVDYEDVGVAMAVRPSFIPMRVRRRKAIMRMFYDFGIACRPHA